MTLPYPHLTSLCPFLVLTLFYLFPLRLTLALPRAIEEALFVPEKRSPEDDEQSSSEEPDAEIVTKGETLRRKKRRQGEDYRHYERATRPSGVGGGD